MPQRPSPREEPVKVLIADGDPAVLNLLRLPLERRGFGVATSTCPADAAGVLAEHPADIAVIEVGEPFGFDAIYAIRQLNRPVDIWLVALLPPGEDSQIAVAIEEGADDCMMKPISPRELVARVEAKARRLPPADYRAAVRWPVHRHPSSRSDHRRERGRPTAPRVRPPRLSRDAPRRGRVTGTNPRGPMGLHPQLAVRRHTHRAHPSVATTNRGCPRASPLGAHPRGVGYRFSPGSRA